MNLLNDRLLVAGLGVWILLGMGCDKPDPYQEPPPPMVVVATPVVEDVPVYMEENGTSEAVSQALVTARVRGVLEKILFEPDATVEEGTPLFEIEEDQYVVAQRAAESELSSAEAALETAKADVLVSEARLSATAAQIEVAQADFERNDQLLKRNAVSQNEWDSAKAALETAKAARQGAEAALGASKAAVLKAEASVETARSNLAQAELELGWTRITAPIAGKVSRVLTKVGNLIEPGSQLVEIVQLDPIWVNFNISEKFLIEAQQDKEKVSPQSLEERNIRVDVQRNGDPDFPFHGRIDFADPKIDSQTGTLSVRAVIENGDLNKRLFPGLFVRVRVQVNTLQGALLIPTRAINRDPNGTYVYAVDEGNTVKRLAVQIGREVDTRTVVTNGLEADRRVIVDGIQRVRPGMQVDPQPLE